MKAFYEPDIYPWTRLFSDSFDTIAPELQAQTVRMSALYQEKTSKITAGDEPVKANDIRWRGKTLVFFTIKNAPMLEQIPNTWRLLQEVPNLVSAVLLKLDGNTHIEAHEGYTPDVLRCHLGLVVPESSQCVLRVADERRSWHQRQWLIFDDYLEHEVWHNGVQSRVVLLVDAIRPGLDLTPRQAAERFFTRAPGTRFDADLEKMAAPETWMEWVRAGKLPL